MAVKKLDSNILNAWVDALRKKQPVIAPVEQEGLFTFEPLARASELRLDYDVTVLPPKKFLLPPHEVLLTYKGSNYKSVIDTKPFVLFGVHPYDMAAITQTDNFYLKQHKDSHYAARRDACTIVVLDVEKVSANNFAGYMGTAVTKDGDLLLTRIPGGYLAEARTKKGEALMKTMGPVKSATKEQLEERKKLWEANKKAQKKHQLKGAPQDLPDLLGRSYDHPLWKEKAALCLSCGACNIVCPTCYCFDVQDEPEWDAQCGTRCRSWDGCQLKDFAVVAGNHNFRKNAMERYRHRFYHKAKYFPEMNGDISCVGCGRCVTACVPKIANPVEVFNKLWGE